MGENLLFCAPRNPEDMASGLLHLMRDPVFRERLRHGSHQLARKWFSWDTANARLFEAFGIISEEKATAIRGSATERMGVAQP